MKKFIFILLIAICALNISIAQWQQSDFPFNDKVLCIAESSGSIFAGTEGGGVLLSFDHGSSWTAINTGLNNLVVYAIAIKGTNVFAGTDQGIFLSQDNGLNWIPATNGINQPQVISFAIMDNTIFAGTWGNGIYFTIDNGSEWHPTNMTNGSVSAFAVMGSTIFAGTKNNYVFLSTDGGINWTMADNGLTSPFIRSLAVMGNDIYAGTDGGGVFHSSNNGSNWIALNTGLTNPNIRPLAIDGTTLYAGSHGIFRSIDSGVKWAGVNKCLPAMDIYALTPIGTLLFAGTEYGIWFCTMNEMVDDIEICLVGIDSTSKNFIVWNKPYSPAVDSIYIYRETSVTDMYTKIGAVSNNDPGVFTDTASQPDVKSNKYKLSFNENCGLELTQSPYHKTMHLNINQGFGTTWNLIWELYEGFTVSTYNIYRGTSPDNMELIGNSSGSNTSYSDLTAPAGIVYYQVEIISPNQCSPEKSFNSSRSNVVTNKVSGMEDSDSALKFFSFYPNPVGDFISILNNDEHLTEIFVEITNLQGKVIMSRQFFNQKTIQLDVSEIPGGIYFIKVQLDDRLDVRKFIKL